MVDEYDEALKGISQFHELHPVEKRAVRSALIADVRQCPSEFHSLSPDEVEENYARALYAELRKLTTEQRIKVLEFMRNRDRIRREEEREC